MDLPIILTNAYYLTHNHVAGVNPLAGLGGPSNYRRTSALHPIAGAFFVPAVRVMAAVRGTPKGVPVPVDRSANLRTAVSITCLAAGGDGSPATAGTNTMHTLSLRLHALNPSRIQRAKAHRSMALAALRSDSSLQTRINRYNHHINKARQIENTGGAK